MAVSVVYAWHGGLISASSLPGSVARENSRQRKNWGWYQLSRQQCRMSGKLVRCNFKLQAIQVLSKGGGCRSLPSHLTSRFPSSLSRQGKLIRLSDGGHSVGFLNSVSCEGDSCVAGSAVRDDSSFFAISADSDDESKDQLTVFNNEDMDESVRTKSGSGGDEEQGSDSDLTVQLTITKNDVKGLQAVFGDVNNGPKNSLKDLAGSIVQFLSGAGDKGSISSSSDDFAVQSALERLGSKQLSWNPLRLFDGSKPSPAEPFRKGISNGLRKAQADFLSFSRQLGKYVFIMTGTGAILATGFQLSDGGAHQDAVLWFSWLAGIVLGSMIGAGQVLESHAKAGRRNVVITGSTRGLGKALAREFLRHGDNVVVTSRSSEAVESTVAELRKELQEHSRNFFASSDPDLDVYGLSRAERLESRVVGTACDVSKSEDVQALAAFATREFGTVDIWVNNAGVNRGFRPLMEFSNEELGQIVSTNLTGSMICTREAIRLMQSQPKGGHVFNMDGAGSGGSSTPLTAAYGATKCGLRQLHASLLKECKGSRVGIHTASPGMVLTDLLLSGASLQNKKMFNFICEQPETVARALVPSLRVVKGTGKAVNYLTPPRIILAIVTAWLRRGRWFDEEGRAVYAAEADRLRMWAEGRERSPVTAAMEFVPSGTWFSLFTSSVICAYIILSSSSGGNMPGT